MAAPPVPEGGAQPLNFRLAIVPQPKFSKAFNPKGQVVVTGTCPVCKISFSNGWEALKEHIHKCRREHQHPLLMRTCYCPYCVKKCSDHYALSSHIQANHLSHITNPKSTYRGKDNEGLLTAVRQAHDRQNPVLFAFTCSCCRLSWQRARGIALHFIKNEQNGMSCGGYVRVKMTSLAQSAPKRENDTISYRHDFAVPLVCPRCSEAFTEAYAMSDHIAMKHMGTLKSLERNLADKIQEFPKKKLCYEPFMCATCNVTFQSMDRFADHVQAGIMSSNPCLGEVKVFKYTKHDGRGVFQCNTPATPKRTAEDTVYVEEDSEIAPDMSPVPIDPPAALVDHDFRPVHPIPSGSWPVIKNEPTDEPIGECASEDEVIIKEGPMDEEEGLQQLQQLPTADASGERKVKEEVDEEQKLDVKKEEELWDCDHCELWFTDDLTFIDHMKQHGYVLADPDELAKIESGEWDGICRERSRIEDYVGTPNKVPRTEYPSAPGSGPGSHPKYLPLPRNHDEYSCHWCDFASLYRHELAAHIEECNAMPSLCPCCKKRRFETVEKMKEHEISCRVVRMQEVREQSFARGICCPFCRNSLPNAFIFSAHLMNEHNDLMQWFRFHHLMAPDLLPFRCTACDVGFEGARALLDHFRLREEFGQDCGGALIVHDYQLALRILRKAKRDKEVPVPIPVLPDLAPNDYDVYNDEHSHEFVPSDLRPLETCDVNYLNRCPCCTELWPIKQMMWHIKMEHPKFYFDFGRYTCKLCRHYSFYCPKQYAMHYENCSESQKKESNAAVLKVAPRVASGDAPSMHKGPGGRQLRAIPENIGNEMRPCRYCKASFSPPGLLCHQKMEHPIQHYANAPYQCGRCDDVGFYCHREFHSHSKKCTGTAPDQLQKNIYAITAKEVEMRTGVRRIEVPSYRAVIAEERRTFGTLAAFFRPHNCLLCNVWCTSLETMGEHYKDAHKQPTGTRTPFLCGGCGIVFSEAENLKNHLKKQELLGNIQCFDMATTFTKATIILAMVNVAAPPIVRARNSEFVPSSQGPTGISPIVSNRREALRLDPLAPKREFMSLSRKQAAIKRHQIQAGVKRHTLLPIRHISSLGKSPLSGERNFAVQQLIERNKAASYYKQVSVHERQRKLLSVDPHTPLSLPSTPSSSSNSKSFFRPHNEEPELQQQPRAATASPPRDAIR